MTLVKEKLVQLNAIDTTNTNFASNAGYLTYLKLIIAVMMCDSLPLCNEMPLAFY